MCYASQSVLFKRQNTDPSMAVGYILCIPRISVLEALLVYFVYLL